MSLPIRLHTHHGGLKMPLEDPASKQKRTRLSKPKVRTGCKTCKTRRVTHFYSIMLDD
ncbi:hypothetical protein PMG11_05366 [Penicillium brasilianum]|uniref:Uncharacterized protein n=1 Tax=Penicillium brasilianum TaxID=104259 RepID=A0A0F7VFB6_PENBI|nr:hypothetical protein PMG11_05366 [Penicillium brasilianum]